MSTVPNFAVTAPRVIEHDIRAAVVHGVGPVYDLGAMLGRSGIRGAMTVLSVRYWWTGN